MKNLWKKVTGITLGAVMALGVGVSVAVSADALQAKAEDQVHYTANYSAASYISSGSIGSSYTATSTYSLSDGTITKGWSCYGGNPNNYAVAGTRFGGKNGGTLASALANAPTGITGTYYVSYLNTTATMEQAISKVEVTSIGTFGTASFVVGKKMFLQVSSNADFSSSTTYENVMAASTTLTFDSSSTWAAASYYRIVLERASTSTTNSGLIISNVKFYKQQAAAGDIVTSLSVSPTSKSYTIGDTISSAAYAVTANLNGTPNTEYANYHAEVGSKSGETFTSRSSVIFDSTTIESADNCLRFYANDPTTDGGATFATADVALTVGYATLESIAISPESAELVVGGTQQLYIAVTPSNADPSVSWSSTDDLTASVSSSGLVTSVKEGSVTITATSTVNSGISNSILVTVVAVTSYTLITDISQLTEGLKVVIGGTKVSTSTSYAMSATQNTNNRAAVESTLTSGLLTPETGYAEFTLGITTKGEATVYTFHDASGYIYAPGGTTNNYLRSQTTLTDDGKWLITLTDGVFSLVAQGTQGSGVRNIMRFNLDSISNPLFSCYSTGQNPVALYGIISDPQAEQDAAAFATSFISATETCSTSASGAWAAQKTAFQALSSNAKAVLVNATYVASNYAANTSVQKCAQRYDLAVSRQSLENFMGRAAISSAPLVNFNYISTSGSVIAIIVISIISLSALSFVVLKRKNK
ncbi:MAG: Ig-like domain-containing protein [Bacilli bacterium]|jgi:uncharacterized protein YjdB